MAKYKIFFKESVEKDFHLIPKKDIQKILKRIEALAKDPRPQGHEKLTGKRNIVSARDNTGSSILFKIKSLPFGW
jgi:mRNA-degrading endonuclease RelE of RelBE toxin-antitoxin system